MNTIFTTPIILLLVDHVVSFLTAEIQKAAIAESSSLVSTMVKKLFKQFRGSDEKSLPALTRDQAQEIYRLVTSQAHSLNVPDEQGQQLAYSVVGMLVVDNK